MRINRTIHGDLFLNRQTFMSLYLYAFLACAGASGFAADESHVAEDGYGPLPLQKAHAHNDYEHERPLLDALDHGFCGVEADIWLVDGALLVAHDLKNVKPERTLESLYLDPLRERVTQNEGTVYKRREGTRTPEFVLLIDVKSAADPTYARLTEVLENYRDMLTSFEPSLMERRGVTIVISGNRAIGTMFASPKRLSGYDGRLPDLKSGASTFLMPLVSDNWTKAFKWNGEGAFSERDRMRLKSYVAEAHGQGRRIRFWATPDRPEVWRELLAAGVDLINTDDLAGLQKFLLSVPEVSGSEPPAQE